MSTRKGFSTRKSVIAVCAAALLGGAAFAQAPVFDPNQLPAFTGKVQQFTLTPRGDIDGMILSDGTEVKVPPHVSTQIAAIARVGEDVTVHGLKAAAMPLIEASSVSNAKGQTVVDNGPHPHGPRGKHKGWFDRGGDQTTIQGRVRMTLHGPRGDVNGALLEDGTVVRMPPHEAARFASLLAAGQTVSVSGDATTSVLGKVMEARAIGASQDALTPVGAPPPPPPVGGPQARADAPPPAGPRTPGETPPPPAPRG